MSAVGCTAFPLALQILDVELLQPKHRTKPFFANHQQQRLNMLIDAMKTYRPRYYIVDWVARTIRHIVAVAHSTQQQPASVASWLEILQRQPGCYLRLAMTMDLSISHGKLPEESDFPPGLRDVVRNGIAATLSPTIASMNINQFRHLEPAANSSDKDTTRSTDTDGKSTPGFPSEDAVFDDNSTTFDFDAPGTVSISPNASSFTDMGAWPDAIFPFNPTSPLTAIQPGLMDFPMGGIVDSSLLFDPSQWTDNQSNSVAEVQDFQVDESFLDMLRETAGINCRNNDERLLDQLGKVVNMS